MGYSKFGLQKDKNERVKIGDAIFFCIFASI